MGDRHEATGEPGAYSADRDADQEQSIEPGETEAQSDEGDPATRKPREREVRHRHERDPDRDEKRAEHRNSELRRPKAYEVDVEWIEHDRTRKGEHVDAENNAAPPSERKKPRSDRDEEVGRAERGHQPGEEHEEQGPLGGQRPHDRAVLGKVTRDGRPRRERADLHDDARQKSGRHAHEHARDTGGADRARDRFQIETSPRDRRGGVGHALTPRPR